MNATIEGGLCQSFDDLRGEQSDEVLVRSGALAGGLAAVCTTAVAAIATAADVSLEVDDTAIPVPAFEWWTLVGAALGIEAARLLRERRRFVVVTAAAVGLSLVPAIAAPDEATTSPVLVRGHLLAAGLIIHTLGRELRRQQAPPDLTPDTSPPVHAQTTSPVPAISRARLRPI